MRDRFPGADYKHHAVWECMSSSVAAWRQTLVNRASGSVTDMSHEIHLQKLKHVSPEDGLSIIERLPTMDVHVHQLAMVSELTGMRPSVVDASYLTGYIRASRLSTRETASSRSNASRPPRVAGNGEYGRGTDEYVANLEAVTRYSQFIDEGYGSTETAEEAEVRHSYFLPVSHGKWNCRTMFCDAHTTNNCGMLQRRPIAKWK